MEAISAGCLAALGWQARASRERWWFEEPTPLFRDSGGVLLAVVQDLGGGGLVGGALTYRSARNEQLDAAAELFFISEFALLAAPALHAMTEERP
jgi:hypothetical protein